MTSHSPVELKFHLIGQGFRGFRREPFEFHPRVEQSSITGRETSYCRPGSRPRAFSLLRRPMRASLFANWIDSRDCRDCTLLSPPARRFEVLGRVLINAQIAAGLRAYFAATPSLVLVLLLTVVQKTAIDGVVL